MKKKPKGLYAQVLFAIFCGVLIGYFYSNAGESMKPLGDASAIALFIGLVVVNTLRQVPRHVRSARADQPDR